jgi:hypothetical protein
MSDTLPLRPTFSNGQYIGADDLNAAVSYARDESERLALSGRTWGIATGLALVELTDATGATQMYIEPGIAWDGYGRPIVVISPAAVTADMFAGLTSGSWPVWLKYSALSTQMIAPGFQTCGAGDPATRIGDTYAIVAGPQASPQQTDGIVLNGVTVADPRNMLIAFDAAAAVVLDGSAPHQIFPDDSAEWLVPVGIVSYVAGSPGKFIPRLGPQLLMDRVARRYVGTVAESVFAADGVLRLRDRQTDQQTGKTNDDLDSAAAIQTSDVQTDTNNPTRVVGYELVWVEGNMRVIGDARLWGGELSFRAGPNDPNPGSEPEGSLFLRRNADQTSASSPNQNIEVSIGQPATGVNRLVVAPSNSGVLATPPALAVGTDSKVGIGVAVPKLALDINGDFGSDAGPTKLHLNGSIISGQSDGSLLLTASNGTIELGADGVPTHVAIGTSSPQADTALDIHGGGVALNKPTGSSAPYSSAFLRLLGSEVADFDDGILRIRSGGATVAFDGNNNVGINTISPAHRLDVNGDANVSSTLSAGSVGIGTTTPGRPLDVNGDANVAGNLRAGTVNITGSLTLGGGIAVTNTSAAFIQLLGSKVSDDDNGVLHLWSGGSTVLFDGPNFDNVGIGQGPGGPFPASKLDVNGDIRVRGNLIYYGSITPGPSDGRLKRDIRRLESALDKLLALRGVEFEWTHDEIARLRPGRQAGLIAQEVEAVYPGWVRDDPATGMKLLGIHGFEALAIEALRELASRVEKLERENERLTQIVEGRAAGEAKSGKSAEKPEASANVADPETPAAKGRDKPGREG